MTRRRVPVSPVGSTKAVDHASPAHQVARITDELACKVLGWRSAPDRFLKARRRWIPRSRFKPFARLDDAFLLLERAGCTCVLSIGANGIFTASVQIGDRIAKASGEPKARAITLALCRALGIEAA
jgi:hypothetical protein